MLLLWMKATRRLFCTFTAQRHLGIIRAGTQAVRLLQPFQVERLLLTRLMERVGWRKAIRRMIRDDRYRDIVKSQRRLPVFPCPAVKLVSIKRPVPSIIEASFRGMDHCEHSANTYSDQLFLKLSYATHRIILAKKSSSNEAGYFYFSIWIAIHFTLFIFQSNA